MWFFLALGSAIIYSLKGILEKRIISNVNNYVLAFAVRLFALPFFFLPFIIYPGLFHVNILSGQFWAVILLVSIVNTPIETVFYYKALESEDATFILPFLTIGPALTLFYGSFLLKEIPTFQGILGALFILLGIYFLRISQAKEGLLGPFRHMKNSLAVRLILIVVLSQSIAGIFDKVGVVSTNAYVYGLFSYITVTCSLFVIVIIKAKKHTNELFAHGKSFLLIGIVIASYTLLNYAALQTGFAGYVAIVRSSYVLFTLFWGLILLKEKNIPQKFISAIFILLGLILLKLFS